MPYNYKIILVAANGDTTLLKSDASYETMRYVADRLQGTEYFRDVRIGIQVDEDTGQSEVAQRAE
jgi:hypothetical protein